ncbi:MAG: hypothetical protein JWR34_1086 [Mycobacterium sp.]|nr:hypothetical protein [Mycobacterium sp.]
MQLLAYPRSVARSPIGSHTAARDAAPPPSGNVRLAEQWAAAVGSFVDRRAKAAERRPKDYVRLAGAHRRRHFLDHDRGRERHVTRTSASDGMQR